MAAKGSERAFNDPLCVRFPSRELALALKLAATDDLPASAWIREVVMMRAQRIVDGEPCAPLRFGKPYGSSNQICIRFRLREWELVRQACFKENALPSPWIRAEVMRRVKIAIETGRLVPDKDPPSALEEPVRRKRTEAPRVRRKTA
jgi:hypothetical protein